MTTVTVIYVAYRTPIGMLKRSVESVRSDAQVAGVDLQILIADNGGVSPTDLELMGVEVTGTGENVGFGEAVNAAVMRASGEFCLLMNPDSSIRAGSLSALIEAGRTQPHALLGALLVNAGVPQVHAYNVWTSSLQLALRKRSWRARLDTLVGNGRPARVDRLCGAGLFSRTDDLRRLGPFDPSFFLYGEDVDLSLRARAAGYQTVLVPLAVVDHDAGTSSPGASAIVERARIDGHLRIVATHRSRAVSLLSRIDVILAALLGTILSRDPRTRTARLARVKEVRRWGLQSVAPRFDPQMSAR